MKLFKVLCVLALVFAVSATANAETQSVKVSGDLAIQGIARDDYDLLGGDVEGNGQSSDWSSYGQAITEIQIDADLTDNVAGVVRIFNQRVWGDMNYDAAAGDLRYVSSQGTVGARNINGGGAAFEVQLDLAYIELKEFLYSPLTLRIGRQDLWFGKGFIIGANFTDQANAVGGTLYATEYSAQSSFDAIRGTLDYDPWTIDVLYAKIQEQSMRADDDVSLWGTNVGYVFDSYNAEAEAYWFYKQSRHVGTTNAVNFTPAFSVRNGQNSNDVHTFGGRGSFDPIEDWTVALEGAYQTGDFIVANSINDRQRSAWAVDAALECRYFQDDFAWKPVVGVEYIFYSGQINALQENMASDGGYDGWDPMFRGKFDTAIREFQNVYYSTAQASTPSATNQHQILVTGTVEPTDSLTLDALYGHFWLDEQVNAITTSKNIGDEIDLSLTWDYTEDVQFNLLSAWFFPGPHFTEANGNDIATDIVGTVKLSF